MELTMSMFATKADYWKAYHDCETLDVHVSVGRGGEVFIMETVLGVEV